MAYRVGRVQQGDGEGNEAWEVGVREGEALHVEVRAVLAARELQGVRGPLGPQNRFALGELIAPWESAGEAQGCTSTLETPSSSRCCDAFPGPPRITPEGPSQLNLVEASP